MKKLHPFLPAVVWAVLILLLTLLPGKFFPKVNYWSVFALDKYVHFSIFFVQVWLLLTGAQRHALAIGFSTYLLFLFLAISFGVFIEFIQTQIPSRSFEFNDMVANSVGCVLGGLVFYFWKVRSV